MRTFPSLIKKIKSIGSVSAPKEVFSKAQVMASGAFNLPSASEVARDRTQVYNALRNISRPKSRNTGHPKSTDYHKLQMLLFQGDYIKSVEYVSNDNNKIKTGQVCKMDWSVLLNIKKIIPTRHRYDVQMWSILCNWRLFPAP